MANSMRVSADVWALAGEIVRAKGLQNERAAIEAVFRTCAEAYLEGGIQHTPKHPEASPQTPTDSNFDQSAAADLDAALSF
jgi:hypothetical protein